MVAESLCDWRGSSNFDWLVMRGRSDFVNFFLLFDHSSLYSKKQRDRETKKIIDLV